MRRRHDSARPWRRGGGAARALVLSALLAVAAAVAGCGEEERPSEPATEAETATAGGFRWFVPLFRELNPRIAPDRNIVGGRRPEDGHAFWMATVSVCNASARARRPPEGFRVVDAFGQAFRPIQLPSGNPVAYAPKRLEPEECLPAPGSVADRTLDGAALVFEIPNETLEDRPFFLRLPVGTAEGDDAARIRLDL